jgi:hypothetical protein
VRASHYFTFELSDNDEIHISRVRVRCGAPDQEYDYRMLDCFNPAIDGCTWENMETTPEVFSLTVPVVLTFDADVRWVRDGDYANVVPNQVAASALHGVPQANLRQEQEPEPESKNVAYPPWTEDQVDNLNERQTLGYLPGYTCKRRGEPDHRWHGGVSGDYGLLRATIGGLVCDDCDYTQEWAHPADVLGYWPAPQQIVP